MKKEFRTKFISLLLSLDVLLLSGCSSKTECNIDGKHMHEYTNEYGIERYINSEKDYVGGYLGLRYDKTDNYIELDEENEKLYKYISDNDLVDILSNYDELISFQSSLYDYLEFQYSYQQTHIMPSGKSFIMYSTTEYRWTSDPNHSNLTGKTRIQTHVFYGYNVIKNDKGRYKIQKSGPVNDINTLIQMGYKYIKSDLVEEMTKSEYLSLIGITEDTDEYIEEYDGEVVRLILK